MERINFQLCENYFVLVHINHPWISILSSGKLQRIALLLIPLCFLAVFSSKFKIDFQLCPFSVPAFLVFQCWKQQFMLFKPEIYYRLSFCSCKVMPVINFHMFKLSTTIQTHQISLNSRLKIHKKSKLVATGKGCMKIVTRNFWVGSDAIENIIDHKSLTWRRTKNIGNRRVENTMVTYRNASDITGK